MQRESKRSTVRLDYKILHTTGERVAKSDVEDTERSEVNLLGSVFSGQKIMDSLDQLSILEATLADDITDFLEENQIDDDDSYSVSDVEALITKSEENRSSYRKMHKELLALMGDMLRNMVQSMIS